MPDPKQLSDFRRHAEWALIAATAHELGLLEALSPQPATAPELADARSLSPRGVEILLGALEELALVEREGARYRLTAEGRAAFVEKDSGAYQGDAVRHWLHSIREWASHMGDVVRTGAPPHEVEAPGAEDVHDSEALGRFMAAMDNKSAAQVEAVVEGCLARVPNARDMLDLGGGPGTFARAFARRGVRATLFDRPEVIDLVAKTYGLREIPELRLERGNFLEDLPKGEFDVVLLANITHIYDPETNARLLRSATRNVRQGGVLAVLDFVRGVSGFAPLFAITMLMNTEGGSTYRMEEYEEWLQGAGLREVRCTDVDADRQLITALR